MPHGNTKQIPNTSTLGLCRHTSICVPFGPRVRPRRPAKNAKAKRAMFHAISRYFNFPRAMFHAIYRYFNFTKSSSRVPANRRHRAVLIQPQQQCHQCNSSAVTANIQQNLQQTARKPAAAACAKRKTNQARKQQNSKGTMQTIHQNHTKTRPTTLAIYAHTRARAPTGTNTNDACPKQSPH